MKVLRRSLFCGSLPPPTAFPRGFFAGARPRLVCPGRRRGSARSARTRPVRGLGVGISSKLCPVGGPGAFRYSLSPHEVFWRSFFRCVVSDPHPPGASATLSVPQLWRAVRASRSKPGVASSKMYALQASLGTTRRRYFVFVFWCNRSNLWRRIRRRS